jgi:hypothetical protein
VSAEVFMSCNVIRPAPSNEGLNLTRNNVVVDGQHPGRAG